MSKVKDKFTVGELARKGGVSVRTLQYYDAVGLLVPKEYSEGKRRMYGKPDIIRLQQILFLKSLGFSLEEIRDRLLPAESAKELEAIFRKQMEAMVEQISHIREAADLMEKVIGEIKSNNEINIESLFAIMGSIRMGNPYTFMIQHFSKDQMDYFSNSFEDDDAAFQFNKVNKVLTVELLDLYKKGEDPAGPIAQELAAKWWDLVMQLTKGDPGLIRKMFALGADESNWPAESRELLEANKQFLGKALLLFFNKNNIKIPFLEGV